MAAPYYLAVPRPWSAMLLAVGRKLCVAVFRRVCRVSEVRRRLTTGGVPGLPRSSPTLKHGSGMLPEIKTFRRFLTGGGFVPRRHVRERLPRRRGAARGVRRQFHDLAVRCPVRRPGYAASVRNRYGESRYRRSAVRIPRGARQRARLAGGGSTRYARQSPHRHAVQSDSRGSIAGNRRNRKCGCRSGSVVQRGSILGVQWPVRKCSVARRPGRAR